MPKNAQEGNVENQVQSKPISGQGGAESSFSDFIDTLVVDICEGEVFETDQERRWHRSHGGHCSGGGGPC